MKNFKRLLLATMMLIGITVWAENNQDVKVGADQTSKYMKLLKGKRVAFVGNQTSVMTDEKNTHLVDYLVAQKINLVKVFAPEHGFRDMAAAGAKITDGTDPVTGVPVVSLYGKNYKPTEEMLKDVDIIIYDIQDVGCRFYTYISTMTYVMEAAAELGKKVIVLDRPNPNGHYIDGNILDMEYKSFVGMHPVPIVYGMTAGEYAQMVNGEGWMKDGVKCDLTVIPCKGYNRSESYSLPVPPSPNLATDASVAWYPSICYFEGTPLSEGRGTVAPFEMFGSPNLPVTGFKFTPKSSKNKGVECNGVDLRGKKAPNFIDLKYVVWAYENYDPQEKFILGANLKKPFFDLLCGGPTIRKQILSGMSAEEIRATWKEGLDNFKKIRAKYLIYPDVE
ncbi:MAG: DUF1343 domain-containing protein [Flavobacteriales bacterium]|nr:DUF1343 domain-containing protein [Flavobacteriales bacterium]MBQ8649807.1 DUF1343 domain-containing protein [Flavobacteriales bacterium]